ncbi:MAG: hypothetical protein WBF33_15740 [Candidatus Nitrosopolaris sp.]
MPASLSTTLKKLESVSSDNQIILQDFYHTYMQSKGLRSEHHITNSLILLISLDKFYGPLPFTSINTKEQILTFLDHQWDGKGWIKRQHDSEGRYISSFNLYLGLANLGKV